MPPLNRGHRRPALQTLRSLLLGSHPSLVVFKDHGGPIPFISESCSANIDDGSDGTVRLFLFERYSETIGAGCRRNGQDLSITASQWGKTSIGGAASSANRARTASSIEGVKLNVAHFFSKAVIGRTRLAMSGKNLR